MKKGFRALAATVLVLALLMFGGTAFATSLNAGITQVYLTKTPPSNCTVSTGQVFPDAFYVVTVWSNGTCSAAIDPPYAWFN